MVDNMKMKKFCLFLILICLVSCSCRRINTIQDIEETLNIANDLIVNIEKYKSRYGEYPKKIENLVPEFYSEAPSTKMKQLNRAKDEEYYVYRDFMYYPTNKGGFSLSFDASLIYKLKECHSFSMDGCGTRSYSINSFNYSDYYYKIGKIIFYKNFAFHNYNNCARKTDLECIFKKELKCDYR